MSEPIQVTDLFTQAELDLPILSNAEVFNSDRYFAGQAAVAEVERRIGRELDAVEEHIVEEEGFVVGRYYDDATPPVETAGVGQTGDYITQDFSDVIDSFEDEVRGFIPSYENQPEDVQIALMSALFRGDLQQSPTFRDLFNAGQYAEAADEFLNHEEYRQRLAAGGDGVTARLENIANTVRGLAQQGQPMTYTVRPGDTMTEIAARHGLDLATLQDFNGMSDAQADQIRPGQVINLTVAEDASVMVDEEGNQYEIANVFEDTVDFFEDAYDYGKSQLARFLS